MLDILPPAASTWNLINIGALYPDALVLLTDFGASSYNYSRHSIKPLGASNVLYGGAWHKWPFANVPASGIVENFVAYQNPTYQDWQAYAYIKADAIGDPNGIALHPFAAGDWNTRDVTSLSPLARWAFIETDAFTAPVTISARKYGSYFGQLADTWGHNYVIVHVNEDRKMQLWQGSANTAGYLRAISY
ncbi:hypothetical protein ES708_25466 [subsurface metagenome]